MSSTDDRIVRMQFDNAQFKKGAADTQKSLADLNKATDAAGKGKGLLDLGSNMEKVSVQASKMAIATTTALATIANKVTNVGLSMASSLTLDPLKSGFLEYESMLTKQNVIMNATGKSAKRVKQVLNNLNEYSDKTIYSFGDMTGAITKFVNAGVPLGTSVKTIKGIANAAAFAGANSEEASRAMYAFSQSMSLGFVGLQDWMQIENANMGTVRFKNELLKAGVAAGTLTKKGDMFVTKSGKMISATKGWRDGLQEQWASTEVLNKALGKYANSQTGLGKKAFKAAQEVRTFSAFMDTLKESIGSGWSSIFTSLIGDLGQSTKMWTGFSNAVGGAVGNFFNWLSVALKTWRTMGGFEKTMQGFKNILAPIGAIFDVIGTAFRNAFPASDSGAGKGLYAMSAGFEALTRPLQWLASGIRLLTGPMTVFFQIIKIGGAVIRQLIEWIIDLASGIKDMLTFKVDDGGFFGWLRDLGKWLTAPIKQISDLISKGKSLGDAFKGIKMPKLPKLPSLPGLPSMPNIGGGAGDAVGAGASAATKGLGKAQQLLKGFGSVLGKVGGAIKEFVGDLFSTGDEIGSVFGNIGDFIAKIGEGIAFVFGKINWEDVLAGFNLAVFATFALTMSKMFNAIAEGVTAVNNLKSTAVGVLQDTSGALKAFQRMAYAKGLMFIALAILALAAALWILSKIPAAKLATSLVAMGAMFLMLNATMKSFTGLLNSLSGKKVGITAVAVAASIAILAAAMFIMAGALILFNYVKWGSVLKGLVVMSVMVNAMTAIGNMAAKSAKNMLAGAVAITAMAWSMVVMAGALLLLALVDWESIAKAGVIIGGMVVALLLLTRVPAPTLMATGLAMLAISVGMIAMTIALLMMAMVKWESIGKLAVVLLALAIALGIMMAVGGPVAVSGMLGLGLGLMAIAVAALILNKVNWSSIGKIALILAILTVALAAIGLVSYFVAPALILLGIAVVLLGVGLLAFSTALALAMSVAAVGTAAFAAFATGAALAIAAFLQSLALQAPLMKDSFLKILQSLIDTVVEAVPMVIQGFKDLWKAVKKELGGDGKGGGSKGKDMQKSGQSWLGKITEGIKDKIPMVVEKAKELLIGFIQGLVKHAGQIGATAATFVAKFVGGIASKAGSIIESATKLITNWISGIGKMAGRISESAVTTVIKFINSFAATIRTNTPQLVKALFGVGTAVIAGLGDGLKSMADKPKEWIKSIVGKLPWWAKKLLHIKSPSRVFYDIGVFLVRGLTDGIQDNANSAIRSVASMVGGQIATASMYISQFIQDLDQQAIAARAKADGLAAAAERASKMADKTKTKTDDKAANKLEAAANAAEAKADAADARAEAAKEAQERKEEFNDASLIDKAKMRSEDAQTQLDAAKAAEQSAAKRLIQANALDKQAKVKGVTPAQRKALQKEADRLRAQAAADAKRANAALGNAKTAAADALKYQKMAGDEAAAAFQKAFEADAKSAENEAAYEKMTNAEKAAMRKKQAEELQKQADIDLAKAKELAYTDLEAANELAQLAQEEANQAREYLDESANLSKETTTSTGGGVLGTVVNIAPSEDAAIAMRAFEELYDTSIGAAATDASIEFNQYNTSPEALSPSEIYRQSNNLFNNAIDRLAEAADAA